MLCIDLFCGLGGWAEGFLAEGYDVIGFDIERHDYGTGGYPGQLVIQDALTLYGSQFRSATCIVASPPCQEFSYRAMPWKMAKALSPEEVGLPEPSWWKLPEYTPLHKRKGDHQCMGLQDMAEWTIWKQKYPKPAPSTALFDACFRIQREACEAAGRYIPMVVENVKGAQPWVGPAKAHYGSYYFWGDVESVNGAVVAGRLQMGNLLRANRAARKVPGFRFDGSGGSFQTASVKVAGLNWSEYGNLDYKPKGFNVTAVQRYREENGTSGTKQGGEWWHDPESMTCRFSSRSDSRKAASAQIAKIPFPLAQYIARSFKP